ncbi:MAG: BrnT family toxin [Hydrococcus sp. CRU_1_1]|nr:BrnT family toxin [Hydrococcus sp. CRU_1_1]
MINLQKHGVDFADAVSIFADPAALTIMDEHPDEDRFVTLGMNAFGQLLVVVYTWRGDNIRIISARQATKSERRQYEG